MTIEIYHQKANMACVPGSYLTPLKIRFIHIVSDQNFTSEVLDYMATVKDAVDEREIYNPPRVVKMSDLSRGQGEAPCSTGSGALGDCRTGNNAGFTCTTGNSAGLACTTAGNLPD